MLKIFCKFNFPFYEDYILGFIEKDSYEIIPINTEIYSELINNGIKILKLTDDEVIKFEEIDHKNKDDNNYEISANFYSECVDNAFSFASIPAYNKYETELYVLVIRYIFDRDVYVSYGIGYKGNDPLNPDNWMMYNNYNGKWEEVTYVYQKANVLCWFQLLTPEDF